MNVSIYGMNRILLEMLFENPLEKGKHDFNFKTNLPAGQYLLVLKNEKASKTQKLIIQ